MTTLAPLPGSPTRVKRVGKEMVDASDKMQQAAKTLRKLANHSTYRSQAVDAMRSNVNDLVRVMDNAETRYRGAGDALVDYADKLDKAQAQARDAIAKAGTVDVDSAGAVESRAKDATRFGFTRSPEEQAEALAEHQRAKADLARQQAVLAHAVAEYEEAKKDVSGAAAEAVRRIGAAIEKSKLNDEFWDKFKGFKDKYLVPLLESVITVMDWVSKIAMTIAVLTALVPGLQPIAVAAFAVSKYATAVTLVATAMQVLIAEKSLGVLVAGVLMLAASKLAGVAGGKLAGKFKPGKVVSTTPLPHMTERMDYKQGWRWMVWRTTSESPQWGAAAHEAVAQSIEFGGGQVMSLGESWAADQIDSMIAPGTVWTTDMATTLDVAPVGSDFSSVDVSQIVANSFGNAGDAPITASQWSGGGGGGVGGGGR